MAEAAKSATPAYVSYKSFKNNVRALAADGPLPSHIDTSVLTKMSGSTRNQFMTALKFFRLVDGEGAPSAELAKLAQSSESEWNKLMAELVHRHYPDQIPVLANGTINKLRDSFGDDLKGTAIITPAMRFLIAAATETGVKVAPHIAKAGVKPTSSSRKKGGRRKGDGENDSVDETPSELLDPPPPPPKPVSLKEALFAKFPEFDPMWSDERQQAWFAAYEKLIKMVENEEKS